MSVFQRRESQVQSYARSFPVVFQRARGARLEDTEGRGYIDFLSGAGSLNYGHNHPALAEALIEHISGDGITHGLDMHTKAKADFLTALEGAILAPRGMPHVVQFTGPTGANAVEAALKLARRTTGRRNVVAFTNGFHGVTLGALAATGNSHHRGAAGRDLGGVYRMPYDGYLGEGVDTLVYLERALADPSSGIDDIAAVIVECVQGEGGLRAAGDQWLRKLEGIVRRHDIVLIVDDIQAGCGRTGDFFSFERAGIKPDIITLSKSLSGFGLPFAIVLIDPVLDTWAPGEHNGTFRGNNHAFVTATAAIDRFWRDEAFTNEIARQSEALSAWLARAERKFAPAVTEIRGRGMMQGLVMHSGTLASRIVRHAFAGGLIIETSGGHGEVIKCLAPLTIDAASFAEGLTILEGAIATALADETAGADAAE